MKAGFPYGERSSLVNLKDRITIEQYGGDDHVIEKREPTLKEKDTAKAGIVRTLEALNSGNYDLIILDEICVAVHFGLIEESDISNLFDQKPDSIELVLTGRYCPEAWIGRADLVTEMKEVKHYYQQGVLSRKGFDS